MVSPILHNTADGRLCQSPNATPLAKSIHTETEKKFNLPEMDVQE